MILQFSDYPGLRCHFICGGTPRWWCHLEQCWRWFYGGIFWVCNISSIVCTAFWHHCSQNMLFFCHPKYALL